jgi:hypothetical protein
MAQQTALEWLINEWPVLESNIPPRIIEQAKAMEKKQITKAFADGQETPINNPTTPHYSNEEYYNDTYKK